MSLLVEHPGKEGDEEEDLGVLETERRREKTLRGSDFGWSEEAVDCQVSALALAMATDAAREADR